MAHQVSHCFWASRKRSVNGMASCRPVANPGNHEIRFLSGGRLSSDKIKREKRRIGQPIEENVRQKSIGI